ncbi:MAG: glycosyltransferase family 39 protein, partial [Chloroflexi bacterium]|nr:glycosyltransferase family 39 protein [Chloroflexota bacterium]
MFGLLLGLELAFILAWFLTHLSGFQWSNDEGTYLMRVRLVQQGYRLYRDVWTDQLPGLIDLLGLVFALLGPSVEAGRGLVSVLTVIGLWGAAALARQFGGRAGALAVPLLLVLAPNLNELARALASPDLPSISLGVAGLAAMGRYIHARRSIWLFVSGLLFALGLYIKATALLALAPAALWLTIDSLAKAGGVRTWAYRGLVWGATLILPLFGALAFHDLRGLYGQFVVTQIASGALELKIAAHAVKILRYLADHNWGLAALGLAGAIIMALRPRRRMGLAICLSWLAVSVAVLLVRSPMWPSHHLVVLLPPLAILAGAALSSLWTSLTRRRLGREGALALAALATYAASLPGVWRADAQLLAAPTYQTSLEAVAFLRHRFPQGALVISDYHMIPYRADCLVPPELATLSGKRIQLGLLSAQEMIRITQERQVQAVILWDEQLTRLEEYGQWLRSHYVMAFKRTYHEIYVPLAEDAVQYQGAAILGERIHLHGYSLSSPAVVPGETLDVTLFWQALRPLELRYHGFVHLVAADGRAVAQDDHLAWGEHYPSTEWHVGETIVDTYILHIPKE